MSSDESSSRSNTIFERNDKVKCSCGWEAKFGYGVAITLAIFEAKRLLMLILEVFVEWQVIRFAGGLRPFLFTLADITLGLPAALTTIRAIRPRKNRNCYTGKKGLLKCLRFIIATCAVMNIATLVSIGCHISVRKASLIEIFNASMRLYMNTASYKYTIDEIQLSFQCCGYSSYEDWFLIDWQRVDSLTREDMEEEDDDEGESFAEDEDIRGQSVPFSCCNVQAMAPCLHTKLSNTDTINVNGCVTVIRPVLLRIVIVGYLVTSTLLVTQSLLAILVTKITRKLPAKIYQDRHIPRGVTKRECLPFNSKSSIAEKHKSTSESDGESQRWERRRRPSSKRNVKKIKRATTVRCIASRNTNVPDDRFLTSSSEYDSSSVNFLHWSMEEAAKIKPSVHEQHFLPKRSLYHDIRR